MRGSEPSAGETVNSIGTIGGRWPSFPLTHGGIGGERAAHLRQGAELKAGLNVGDDPVDLAAAHRQADAPFIIKWMPKSPDAIADDFSRCADRGELDVTGEQRDCECGAGFQWRGRTIDGSRSADARLQWNEADCVKCRRKLRRRGW